MRHLVGLALLTLSGCGGPPQAWPCGLDGRPVDPAPPAAGTIQVLVFASRECPIANAYAPTLRALATTWHGEPVEFHVVLVDPDLTTAAATAHATAYQLPGEVWLDPQQTLARLVGATRTPEAFVRTAAGTRYHGRIDDQWLGFGNRAAAPTRHDLRLAVAALLAGQPVPTPVTEAVGCRLPTPHR